MSYQYVDPYGNPYVRGWGNDFTEEERRELEIGEFNWNSPNYKGPSRGGSLGVDPSRITQGKFQMPGLGNRIEDFLSNLSKAPGLPGERRTTVPQDDPRVLGPMPSTTMMGRHPDGTPITFDNPRITQGPATPPMQTPPADVPTPPLEKTLAQRVWERDQKKRVPDEHGRLYPDKNDPDFLDPRITEDGFQTMQYIPELDDPNWRPWGGRSNKFDRATPLGGGEGIQYRL